MVGGYQGTPVTDGVPTKDKLLMRKFDGLIGDMGLMSH